MPARAPVGAPRSLAGCRARESADGRPDSGKAPARSPSKLPANIPSVQRLCRAQGYGLARGSPGAARQDCPPAAPLQPPAVGRGEGSWGRPGPPARARPSRLPLAAGRDVPRSRAYIRAILPRRGAVLPRGSWSWGTSLSPFRRGCAEEPRRPRTPSQGTAPSWHWAPRPEPRPRLRCWATRPLPRRRRAPAAARPREPDRRATPRPSFPGAAAPGTPSAPAPAWARAAGSSGTSRPAPGPTPRPPARLLRRPRRRPAPSSGCERSGARPAEVSGAAGAGGGCSHPGSPLPFSCLHPLPLPPLKRGVFRRCRRRGAVRGGSSRLLRTHQLQHPAAHGAGEGVSLQPVPVTGPPPRGGPLAAPPRRPGEGLVPEPPHEAEEARAGGAGCPRRPRRCPGRPCLRLRRPHGGTAGTSGLGWKLRPAGHRVWCSAAFSIATLCTVLFMRIQGKPPARSAAARCRSGPGQRAGADGT